MSVTLEVPPIRGPRQAALRIVPRLKALHFWQRQRELGNVLAAARARCTHRRKRGAEDGEEEGRGRGGAAD